MLAYMAGVLQSLGCEAILINGVEDHLHILCNLSRTVTLARLVEEAKKANFGRCAGGTGSRSTNGMCGIEVVPPRWG